MGACFFTEVTGQFKILHSKEMCDLYRSPGSVVVGCVCSWDGEDIEHMQNFCGKPSWKLFTHMNKEETNG